MAEFENLKLESQDNVGTITLNHPPVNALSRALLTELGTALDELEKQGARAVILTGAGNHAFSAGVDVKELSTLKPAQAAEVIGMGHEVFNKLEAFPAPIIAAINNLCLGGGLELALACDLRYSSDRARFGFPEVNIGLLPGWGGTQRLPRLIGPGYAKELIYTGQQISAPVAMKYGLVNKVVPEGDEVRVAMDTAKRIAIKSAPLAVRNAKRVINQGLDMKLEDGLAEEFSAVAEVSTSKDLQEGVQAFVEKRQPVFKGE